MLTSKLHLNQSKLRSNTGCQARENAYKQVTLDLNWLRRATSFLRQSWSKVMQNHGNLQITVFINQFKPKLTSDIFIVAEVVVSLDAPDEFLKNRVMNLPESVVAGTHNTEEGLFQIIHDHSKNIKRSTRIIASAWQLWKQMRLRGLCIPREEGHSFIWPKRVPGMCSWTGPVWFSGSTISLFRILKRVSFCVESKNVKVGDERSTFVAPIIFFPKNVSLKTAEKGMQNETNQGHKISSCGWENGQFLSRTGPNPNPTPPKLSLGTPSPPVVDMQLTS